MPGAFFLLAIIPASELCSLTLKDVDFRMNLIKVCGKTGERVLPVSQATRRALFACLRCRPETQREDAFLHHRGGAALEHGHAPPHPGAAQEEGGKRASPRGFLNQGRQSALVFYFRGIFKERKEEREWQLKIR